MSEKTLIEHLRNCGRASAEKRTPAQHLEFAKRSAITRKAKSERCVCGLYTLRYALQRWPKLLGKCAQCVVSGEVGLWRPPNMLQR